VATGGRFITIEGGEGVGKSRLTETLTRALTADLARAGKHLIVTREPGGTPSADMVRGLFATSAPGDPWLIETEAFLVSAARAQHCGRLIMPTLRRGDWVLCDRFADSMRVYQGSLGGLPDGYIEPLIATSTRGLMPDLTLLLDCPVSLATSRLKQRGEGKGDAIKRYDDAKVGFHEKVRQAFLDLQEKFPDRIVVIDASASPDIIDAAALKAVKLRCGGLA
jgi:dTMP kinase